MLIPVRHLIDGRAIAQVPTDRVTYHHLELPQHDVLLADGLPAESFLDLRDGSNYANRPGRHVFTRLLRPEVGGVRLRATDCHGTGTAAARALLETFARTPQAA